MTARLAGLHGHSTNALGAARPDTDIYIDAAGAAIVVNTALRAAKWGARLVTVAVHKKPEPIDLGAMLRSEMTIIASQGYPTEIFEVTPEIVEHQQRFSRLISHCVPFPDAWLGIPARTHPRRRREGDRDLRRLTAPGGGPRACLPEMAAPTSRKETPPLPTTNPAPPGAQHAPRAHRPILILLTAGSGAVAGGLHRGPRRDSGGRPGVLHG